ncbi:ataxin-2 isoform X2 [Folsomia candida]|uniref:ataxin-2 isoform X2 n=1 Tax=Folsomia candida TaxID=158441 RepID=UPI000B8F2A90|nr:ataxin-2 isoform X2 [Folsomia candida]
MKPAHLKGAKGQNRSNPSKPDGRKSENDCFIYNMAILVGCQCEIAIRDGRKFDGVFSAYSSERHELMIEAAHLITEGMTEDTPIQKSFDVLVVPVDKMLSVKFKSVDTTYATRDFATDAAISATRNVTARDKQLTPWDGPDATSDEDLSLDTDLGTGKENGWEAKDMFKKNEEKYGVVSSYSQDLSGYTTQIDKTDSDALKRHEQQAAQVAQEIEKNVVSWERSELENGEDEEEAFSAVVRPRNSSHSHNNNNNNNTNTNNSGGSSDKYIPPSRRMGTAQPNTQPMPQQGIPMNNNGATNNNATNNPRNKIYTQNQTPRGGYGGPPNNSYHDRRNNYDNRRGPPPNQYPPQGGGHNDGRRMDDGGSGRGRGVPNKANDRRGGGTAGGSGREDPSKLKDFGRNFQLSDQNQPPRRMPMNQPHPNAQSMNANIPPAAADLGGQTSTRTMSPPSNTTNKSQKEEPVPQATPFPQASVEVNDKVANSGATGVVSPNSVNNSVSNISVNTSNNNGTPVSSGGNMSNMHTPGSCDSKSSDSDKKKFTFNPNAKEFNPCTKSFTSRSPSTPPRPPSTPAQPSTPQMMPPQQIPQYMPISMQSILYGQPYAQTAALTPSSSSSGSSGGATPRHGGGGQPHRKGGMIGGPPRSDMTPPIQMTAGPPLLVQAAGAPHYAYVPQPNFPQVMRLPPNMPVYATQEGGAAQMHQQVHFMQHNGPQNQHPNINTPSNTPNPQNQTPVVSANGQGYNQGGATQGGASHVGFPYGVVPVMNMGYPHGPPHMLLPYVSSHQGLLSKLAHLGGAAVIPQSQ